MWEVFERKCLYLLLKLAKSTHSFKYTAKADPAPAHRARAPLFEIYLGFIFENFGSITRIELYCNQYATLKICILIYTLTTKA